MRFAHVKVLRDKHIQNQSDLQLVTEEKEKIGKIQQVLVRMINDLTLTDVIETKNVETLRKKIIEVCVAQLISYFEGLCK